MENSDKNANRDEARRFLRDAKKLLREGKTEDANSLITLAKFELTGFNEDRRGGYVWCCRYCQHLRASGFDCRQHPAKRQGWEALRKSLQRRAAAAEEAYWRLVKTIAESGAPLTGGAGQYLAMKKAKWGYYVQLNEQVENFSRLPDFVPDKSPIAQTKIVRKPVWVSGMDGSCLPQPPPAFELGKHLWSHCPLTRGWLTARNADPLLESTRKWATLLFIGDRQAGVPRVIANVLDKIVADPDLAIYLVLRAEAWFEQGESD